MAETPTILGALRAAAALIARMEADGTLQAAANEAAHACITALRAGGKILICGNGGSAADAQHWAGELVSRFHYDRPGLPAIALTTDSSILTAIGNDYGYERVFARQVEALGRAGDVLMGLTTSGRSPNILAAMRAARERGITTIGFTGNGPGAVELAAVSDIVICVPSSVTPSIQEGHEVLGHALCAMIEAAMFPRGA
ncbi:D-sedoheptulose 7-phosphate isomerase [Roseococcus sp. SDR]|uniref:D-sedoheptulose-7-phosphate isomerase n=1 Tax=Roseococcus sp. SDR TaxID=2835532 RepID=UPI001BD098C8|nr:D-sedoheptulose 7-phosphate isomerase [Roseococcus sp. SDR]MBS7791092.1 D-sedoheptulose 7-phosphate isomerase [Roseococcus sp. SDR]MBV1846406.1 D-sedoheptulose 7-phosphate isomerase [Roseococcus sp. SDR]